MTGFRPVPRPISNIVELDTRATTYLQNTYLTLTRPHLRFHLISEEQVVTKWTNIKDTFYKSLKTKMGRPKRKYVLHHELKFLLKGTPQEDIAEEDKSEDYNGREEFLVKEEDSSEEAEKTPHRTKRSKKIKTYIKKGATTTEDVVENNYSGLTNEFVTCDGANEARLMNEDEAFFASLLPTVVRYTLEERLDFRMEVLNVMKRIHSRRNE